MERSTYRSPLVKAVKVQSTGHFLNASTENSLPQYSLGNSYNLDEE